MKDIVEVGKKMMRKFPLPSIDTDFKIDVTMIMRDFPKLSKEELLANATLIEKYYGTNLDYEVLQVLKKTKTPKKEKKDVKLKLNIKDLTRPPMEVRDQHLALGGDKDAQERIKRRELKRIQEERARKAEERRREKEAAEYCSKKQNIAACESRRKSITGCKPRQTGTYNKYKQAFSVGKFIVFLSNHGKDGLFLFSQTRIAIVLDDAYKNAKNDVAHIKNDDMKKDAIRHMYWQMLLCKYYSPPYSHRADKNYRKDFARQVGDKWEEYGINWMDDSVMDLHNNAVGRNLWAEDRHSWDVGSSANKTIHTVSDAKLLQAAKDKYNEIQKVDEILKGEKNGYIKKDYPYYEVKNKDEEENLKKLGVEDKNKDKDDVLLSEDEKRCYRVHWILSTYSYENKPVQVR